MSANWAGASVLAAMAGVLRWAVMAQTAWLPAMAATCGAAGSPILPFIKGASPLITLNFVGGARIQSLAPRSQRPRSGRCRTSDRAPDRKIPEPNSKKGT